jgi:two-component system sensor kinase FixL
MTGAFPVVINRFCPNPGSRPPDLIFGSPPVFMPKPIAESDTFLRDVFDSAVDGILVIDDRGIIQVANPAACRLFGYALNELVGVNVSTLMPSPHRGRHDEYLRRYQKTGQARIIGIGREVEGRRKDGNLFPFRLSVSETHTSDGRVLYTGVVHDITEIKEAERQLRELNVRLEGKVRERTEELSKAVNRLLSTNHELEHEVGERRKTERALVDSQRELEHALDREKELGDLKSRFLTLASHEFRTPLTTILSSASLIARYTGEDGQERRQRHIDRIRSAVRTLTGLLEDFLNVGKLEEGRIETRPERIEAAGMIAEWVADFRETAWKDGEIRFRCDDETYPLQTDPKVLHNMLLNLLSNAVKYSPSPIDVTVRLRKDAGRILLSVSDRGMGIPQADQEHLFERFFRATNVTNIQGTGLGLHIVREYAELLGGTVSFTSREGEGTTFTVHLPEHPEP